MAPLVDKSARLLERAEQLTAMIKRPGVDRRCPACNATLRWSERRQILGQTLDYYQACRGGCGMFYYDNGQQAFVRLLP